MKFDILTNNFLNIYNESIYRTPRPDFKRDANKGTKLGSSITDKEKDEAEKIISQKTQEFKRDPKNAAILLDIFNLVREFPGDGVVNNINTKQEYLKGLLNIAKTKGGMDYELMLKSIEEGDSISIDEWKQTYGDSAKEYYYALRAIVEYLGGTAKERSIREVSSEQVDVYYFDIEGHPFRTYVSVDQDGNVGRASLGKPPLNRTMLRLTGKDQSEHPPVYSIEGEDMLPAWRPKELVGQNIDFVKDALRSEEAKEAFQRLYPSEIKGVSTGTYGMGGRKGAAPLGPRKKLTN